MKDLNKLQKWAKVIFVITVFFFLGYTFYWIVFMLSIANYSSAECDWLRLCCHVHFLGVR